MAEETGLLQNDPMIDKLDRVSRDSVTVVVVDYYMIPYGQRGPACRGTVMWGNFGVIIGVGCIYRIIILYCTLPEFVSLRFCACK